MNTWLKRMGVLALALGFGIGTAQAANPPTSDSLTVTITPNAYYAVNIDTSAGVAGGATMDLGSVELGASTHSSVGAGVEIESTYATTDLTLIGAIITATDPWTFDADTSNNEQDKLAAWAVFTDTSVTVAPLASAGAFSGTTPATNLSDVISASPQDVGYGAQNERFILASTASGYKTMEDMPAEAADAQAAHSKLWLKFRLPASSTGTGAQLVTITLTAGAPN